MFSGVSSMEKGADIGLLFLALTDLLFCVLTILNTFLARISLLYTHKDISFYLTIYGEFLLNILIKTSTWCTVIMSLSRHIAVCYPMSARQYMRPRHTILAMIFSTIFWIGLHLPLLWTWNVKVIQCNPGIQHSKQIILLDFGPFVKLKVISITFTWIWLILGFIIPVLILGYCNLKLVWSLRISRRFQDNNITRRNSRSRDIQQRITITLVAIVIMFFTCVSPSEILHGYTELHGYADVKSKQSNSISYSVIATICNVLQVINFSSNFVLYCVVNSYFRRAVKSLIPCYCQIKDSTIVCRRRGKKDTDNATSMTLLTHDKVSTRISHLSETSQ